MSNDLRVGMRVCHNAYPHRHGTVTEASETDVKVHWDDGAIGDLVWTHGVAHDAHRLDVLVTDVGLRREPDASWTRAEGRP